MVSELLLTNSVVTFVSFVFFSTISKSIGHWFTSSLSCYKGLSEKNKIEWKFRNNSSLHAAIVSCLCIVVLICDGDDLKDILWGFSWKAEATISISLGYIISDTVYMLSSSPSSTDAYWTSLLHHVLVIVSFGGVMGFGYMSFFAVCRLLAEMSTPFVNIRWMLYVSNLNHTNIYFYNGWLMLIVFFVCRILAMPYCYFVILQDKDIYNLSGTGLFFLLAYASAAATIDCMNIFWFTKMVKGALKYYMKRQNDPETRNGTTHSKKGM